MSSKKKNNLENKEDSSIQSESENEKKEEESVSVENSDQEDLRSSKINYLYKSFI